jgi:putative ABC transport system permease protein
MFAGAVILILAVGIGVSTAMFSVIHAVLLQPLPYAAADRIVMVWGRSKQWSMTSVSIPDYRDWRQSARSFEHLALVRTDDVLLRVGNDTEMVPTALVTANFFEVFDLPPRVGRTFAAADDLPNATAAVILSHAFWQSRFGGDPGVVGRSVRVGDDPYTVVGVMPPAFNMPMGTEVWLAFGPSADTPAWRGRGNRPGFLAVASMRPGLALTSARREMSAIAARLRTSYPGTNAGFDVVVTPIMEHLVGDYRRTLWILLGSVVLFLLIACANVGNLLLVRGTHRQRELAVRAALGATKLQIVRQLLTETGILVAAGLAGGLLLVWWARDALLALSPAGPPRFRDITINQPVLLFAIAAGILTSLAAGLWPAWRLSTTDPRDAMEADARTGTARATRRVQTLFVVVQVALTLTLLVAGTQLLRSLQYARNTNLGFDADGLWSARVLLPAGAYGDPDAQHRFVERLLLATQGVPDMDAVAISAHPPLAPGWQSAFMIEGQPDLGAENPYAEMNQVSPSYFRTIGTSLIRGREFLPDDLPNRARVAIVDQALAERAWPGQDPLGKRFFLPGPNWKANPLTVVGVVPTLRLYGYLLSPRNPQIYLPESQSPVRSFFVLARGRAASHGFESMLRRTIRRVDADAALTDARTMNDRIGDTVAPLRLASSLGTVLAGLALALATVGLHAMVAYSVAQRLRELGLRVALGAEPRSVVAMVLRQGMGLTVFGIISGLAGAAALTQFLRGVLVDLAPVDAWSLGSAVAILTIASVLACWWPARRASRLNPLEVLRHN